METSVKLITNYLFNFIWNKKPDKIKRQVLYTDYIDNGLRVPNILTTFKSLNLAWIPRLLKSENCSDVSWSYIPSYYFKRCGGLNFLLRCNYDNHFIKQIDLQLFYKEILIHMLELKQLYGYYQEQDLVLFNNRDLNKREDILLQRMAS